MIEVMKAILTPIVVVSMFTAACVAVDVDEDVHDAEREAELYSVLVDYYECLAAGGECRKEAAAHQEHYDELLELSADLRERPREEVSFRANAIADCTGAPSVSCDGTLCYAYTDWGCYCTSFWGYLQSLEYCCWPEPHVCAPSDCGWYGDGCGGTINCGACQVCTVGMCTNGQCCNEDADCSGGGCIPL